MTCKSGIVFWFLIAFSSGAFAQQYHVSIMGNDSNPGTFEKPFRSISRAAQIAQPGSVITVHE
jgi:hypothetical protein